MNTFESELRRLFADGEVVEDPTFAGRACFGRLDEHNRVRLEFVTLGTADKYEALKATILSRNEGKVDSLLIRFDELWGKKPVANPNFRNGVSPYLWTYNGKSEWYAYQPTAQDMRQLREAVDDYLDVFREPVQSQGMGMTFQ